MAALFRVEFSSAQLRERAKLLQTFGALLHKIIHQYNVTVVCTNQASGCMFVCVCGYVSAM